MLDERACFTQQRGRAALTADILKKNMDHLYLEQLAHAEEIVSLKAHIDSLVERVEYLETQATAFRGYPS